MDHLGRIGHQRFGRAGRGQVGAVNQQEVDVMVAWLLAVVIAVVGVVQLLQGQVLFGILLLVAACAVGPGGYSAFRSRA
jgi:hypothetical protein